MATKLVVGLGNPGREYEKTRHNLGFRVLDALTAQDKSWSAFKNEKTGPGTANAPYRVSECARKRGSEERRFLVEPHTFMNLSGHCVKGVLQKYEGAEMLVVHDEAALPLGTLRFRENGSSAGQNGVESIIAALGTQDFARLRLGIGKQMQGSLSDYVLGPFAEAERPVADQMIRTAVEAVNYWLDHGTKAAMNQFNAKQTKEEQQ